MSTLNQNLAITGLLPKKTPLHKDAPLNLIGGSSNDTLSGGSGDDLISGGAGNDYLYGDAGDDSLIGGLGNDSLFGGLGNDTLNGGDGDDTYGVNVATDVILDSSGNDTVNVNFSSGGSYTMANGIEIANLLVGNYAINVTGNTLNNTITGNTANNYLYGDADDDSLIGGLGNDSLFGGLGNDTLNGGDGDDTYGINVTTDVIQDSSGNDTVNVNFSSGGSYTMADGIENANLLVGNYAINVTGNTLNNTITGNAANNYLIGDVGDDSLIGGLGNDSLFGGLGNDTLNGGDGTDILIGGAGDDILNGAASNDGMDGGLGNDIYLLSLPDEHNIAEISDTGISGFDEVRFNNVIAGTAFNVSADPTLKLFAGDIGIESVVIGTGLNVVADTTSTANLNIDATAVLNALSMTGNYGNNFLAGTVFGDTIYGGAGDDVINGGAGNDLMNGGNGGDYYIVSSHAAAEIADTGTTGVDTVVFTSLLAGDTFKVFAGDTGIEEIMMGQVSMSSFYGFIAIINSSDTTQLNVDASASQNGLFISDNAGNNTLRGSAFDDVISDSGGNDTIIGGAGNDSLNSRGGSNLFVFDTALNGATNVDNINFFTSNALNFGFHDTIQLDHNIFSALNLGALSASDFVIGAAVDATDHILMIGNGVYYDADGSGSIAPIEFVTLTGYTALSAADFIIV